MEQLNKDTAICSDDIIRVFISRRVLPLQRRIHKMIQMSGCHDPTRITSCGLSKNDVVLKARQICQTDMPADWSWGLHPLSFNNPPSATVRTCAIRIDFSGSLPCELNIFFLSFRPVSASLVLLRRCELPAASIPWTWRIRILT
jgi:hypothetical protein